MARSVALQEYWNVLTDALCSPERQSAYIAAFAKEKIKEVEARQGVLPKDVVVDGVTGAAEESVKPRGIIVYFIQPFFKILKELADLIYGTSPFSSKEKWGKRYPFKKEGYRWDQHFVDEWRILVNGQPFAFGVDFDLKPGDEVVVINTMPYARKVERGVQGHASIGGKRMARFKNLAKHNDVKRRAGLSVTTPGKGELQLAVETLKRRYPKFLNIQFIYIPLPAGITNPAGAYTIPGNRYPAVSISIPKNFETGVAA